MRWPFGEVGLRRWRPDPGAMWHDTASSGEGLERFVVRAVRFFILAEVLHLILFLGGGVFLCLAWIRGW